MALHHACFTAVPVKKCVGVLLLTALLPVSAAYAVPFSTDISITGSTDFSESFSIGPTTGDFGITSSGATTLTTFSGSTATGADPLGGTLTDIGDGFGFSGSAATTFDVFGIALDTGISISNSSATASYDVVFELIFSNTVDADGPDAVVDSEMSLSIDGTEVFFSDIISDTFFGDSAGGVLLGTFGGSVAESGTVLLPTITLAPSATAIIDFFWTVEDFSGDYAGGLASLASSSFLSVSSVTSLAPPPPPPPPPPPGTIPEPGTLLLLLAGILSIPMVRKISS